MRGGTGVPKTELDYNQDFGPQFQRHILAVASRVPGFAMRCRDVLDHEFFAGDVDQAIAEALLDHVDKHQQIPTSATLIEDVREIVADDDMEVVEAAIAEIYKQPIHDADAVEEKIIAFGKRSAMLNAVIKSAEQIEKGNPDEVEELIRKAMLVGEALVDVGSEYVPTVEDRIRAYLNPEIDAEQRIPTGIKHLDFLLDGGLKRGELGVVLAPPKRGKSTLLINLGFGALRDLDQLNVVHYSLEMDREQVLRRYDDRVMGKKVKTRRSDPDDFVATLRKRMGLINGRLMVKQYPTRGTTVAGLRSHLSVLLARGFAPDLVIVDYAGILKASSRRSGDYRHEQASIFEDLRGLAGEFRCAIWTGQQANRGSLDKDTITMADVAETFEVAAVCDAMFALCQTSDEAADGICRLFAAAVRDAASETTVECNIRRDACTVTSRALHDVAGSRVYITGEDPEKLEDADKSKASRVATARRAAGDDSKPAKPSRRPAKKAAKKSGSKKKTAKKAGTKKAARRRATPSKSVPPKP